jgi:hypothetical protein
MKTIAKKLWTEPALVVAVVVGLLNAALFLPDIKAAAASLVLSLAGGGVVRQSVSPTKPNAD